MNLEQFIILIIGIITGSLSISTIIYLRQQELDPSMLGWFYIIGCGLVSIILLGMFIGFIPMVEFR